MGQRTKRVILRLTDKEHERLMELVRNDPTSKTSEGKDNVSAYIRKVIFGSIGTAKDMKRELRDLKYQIRKIGVNINQATKHLNQGHRHYSDEPALLKQLRIVESNLTLIYHSIKEQNRNFE